ncbi:MAG: M48 family metallopeptidase [Alphaproteobacteria bacterium]|nr:M48 family metallopeptidase [Alphaproteobacteria bacterium]MCL2505018.1 M48 family metallopeptidase [Alphaproteobacteria bacterium]
MNTAVKIGDREVLFFVKRSRQRRASVSFSVEKDLSIQVSAPYRTSVDSIAKILKNRASWIARRIGEIQKNESTKGTALFLGEAYEVKITRNSEEKNYCRLEDKAIKINIQDEWLSQQGVKEEAALELMCWYKKEIKSIFIEKLGKWSEKIKISYDSFRINNAMRQWGSCDYKNVISLNWRLVMAPKEIIDYVIIHELCHIKHKNHSEEFWKMVEKYYPGYKEAKKHLRENITHYEWHPKEFLL